MTRQSPSIEASLVRQIGLREWARLLWARGWGTTGTGPSLKSRLLSGHRSFWLEKGGMPIGFMTLHGEKRGALHRRFSPEAGDPLSPDRILKPFDLGIIDRLTVRDGFRWPEVAAPLIAHGCSWFAEQGIHSVLAPLPAGRAASEEEVWAQAGFRTFQVIVHKQLESLENEPSTGPVRRATAADLPRLRVLVKQQIEAQQQRHPLVALRPDIDWESYVGVRLNHPRSVILVAEVQSRLVGYVEGQLLPARAGRLRAWTRSLGGRPPGLNLGLIIDVAVLPDYRRQQIGSTLIRSCLRWLQDHQAHQARAAILIDNAASRRTFASLGFETGQLVMIRHSCAGQPQSNIAGAGGQSHPQDKADRS